MSLVFAPALAAPVTLELRSAVLLDRARITLADLAIVHADSAVSAALGRIELGHAPRVGYADHFTRSQLESLIRRRAAGTLASVAWSGAASVTVRTRTQVINSAELAERATSQVRAEFSARHPGLGVAIGGPVAEVEIPTGEYQVKARALGAVPLAAHLAVWLDVLVDGAIYRSVVVPVSATLQQDVYAARHALAAGALAGPADFNVRTENVAGLEPIAIAAQAAPAWRLRQAMQSGQVLTQSQLPAPGTIFRGDHIRLLVRSGAIGIEADGIALAEATPGQLIGVRTTASAGTITGRLTAAGTVVVE